MGPLSVHVSNSVIDKPEDACFIRHMITCHCVMRKQICSCVMTIVCSLLYVCSYNPLL